MLIAAFLILALAVALGTVLAVLHLRSTAIPAAPWQLAALHGTIGVGGLCWLWLSLRGVPRGVDQGVASFGAISAALLMVAALAGIAVMLMHWRKRRAGVLIGLHATLAISAFVVLAAYLWA
jgi:hypothetical protein